MYKTFVMISRSSHSNPLRSTSILASVLKDFWYWWKIGRNWCIYLSLLVKNSSGTERFHALSRGKEIYCAPNSSPYVSNLVRPILMKTWSGGRHRLWQSLLHARICRWGVSNGGTMTGHGTGWRPMIPSRTFRSIWFSSWRWCIEIVHLLKRRYGSWFAIRPFHAQNSQLKTET